MIQRTHTTVSILFLLLILGFLSIVAQSLRFDLELGHTKCIYEDIKTNSMTVGKYSVVNPSEDHPMPDDHKVTVRVSSTDGNIHHAADDVESGQFAFQAVEAGDYSACFWAGNHNLQAKITVEFDWRSGMAAKDWSNVAKKGSVEAMQLELNKMEEMVTSIHEEMFYLREREEEMQELNRATNSRMAWLTFLSLVICLSVGGLQLWHLKAFFEKKKII
ncbi:transmembrane emp24 domain-containing protein p24delta9-like [Cornus florida]|uniref:transmembrane emp24 domain-containing protein p24delta9-like n=1 Tax=Cornus florida TaxID=4283 RepID=UPI002898CE75|nr:transmembrane emp24 domain-containing protein p24delta9-like [Cornus florida]